MEAQEEAENDMFDDDNTEDGESDEDSDEDDSGERGEVNEEELKTVSDMVNGIKSFMENVSGYEGAEIPGEQQGPLDFDPEEFFNTLKRTVGKGEGLFFVFDCRSFRLLFFSTLFCWIAFIGALENLEGKLGNQKSPGGQNKKAPKPNGPTIVEIMDAMDAELSTTKMAEDFEKSALRPPQKNPAKPMTREESLNDHGNEQEESGDEESDADDHDDDDSSRPVDLNLNLVKNLLESFSSQQGMSGPASSLLSSLGLDIPYDSRK